MIQRTSGKPPIEVDEPPTAVFVPPSVLYPGLDSSFERFRQLVSELSRDDALVWVARLNIVLWNPNYYDDLKKQQYCVDILDLPTSARKALDRFTHQHGGPQHVQVFFRAQLLELLRWIARYCTNHESDGITFEQKAYRRAFSQAALIAGEQWAKRIYAPWHTPGFDVSNERHVEQSVIRTALQASGHSPELPILLSRTKRFLLDLYFDCDSEGAMLAAAFEQRTGFSPREFFDCATVVFVHCLSVTPEEAWSGKTGLFSVGQLCENCPGMISAMQRYVDFLSQSPQQLQKRIWPSIDAPESFDVPYSYRPFLDYPVLRLHDGRAIVLDPHLYVSSVLDGPAFLARIEREQGPLRRLGDMFERYCAELFCPESNNAKRTYCFYKNVRDADDQVALEADVVLCGQQACLIAEMKHAFLPDSDEEDPDSSKLIALIERKYGYGDGIRGYAQLGRLIREMILGNWNPSCSPPSDVTLIPVLVVHDPYVATPLTIKYLADRFDAEFPGGKIDRDLMTFNGRQILRLIVLDIEEVERLGRIIDETQLFAVLREYSKAHADRMRPLTHFIGRQGRWTFRPRNSHVDQGIDWLDEIIRRIFPGQNKSVAPQ